MANKVLKKIEDAKRRRDFKQRSKRRFETDAKKKTNEREKFVQRKYKKPFGQKNERGEEPKKTREEEIEEIMNEEDVELEQELARDEMINEDDEFDETEFLQHGDQLDLPDSGDEEDDFDKQEELLRDAEGELTDSDLEDYYKELGIQDEEDFSKTEKASKKGDAQYKVSKKQKDVVVSKKETVEQARERLLEQMIKNTKDTPNYNSITKVIKVVKQVFNVNQQKEDEEDQEEEDNQKKGKKKGKGKNGASKVNLAAILGSAQYKKLLIFFAQDIPQLILRVCSVNLKPPGNDKSLKEYDLKKVYGHLSSKQQLLLKTYSANYTRLLHQTIEEGSNGAFVEEFLVNGLQVAQVILPFGIYKKKLSSSLARIIAAYSTTEEQAQILAYQTLRALIVWNNPKQDASLFEFAAKKLYNEFTKESKFGGGGFQVQDKIRIAQNCFVELLGLNTTAAYQLGFLYIRSLCLHLRNIRNNLTKDGIKNVYSWQFYNCLKLLALAIIQHQQELNLLVHPFVQLAIGTIRLSNNIKYFPFHIKVFHLLSLINQHTKQFIPIAQYILYPFDMQNELLNSKSKALQDKSIPETLVSLKIAKKHQDTQEMKDRIVKEILEELTIYYANNSRCLSFPEMAVPLGVLMRKFKKHTTNSGYRKTVAAFLDQVKKNEDYIIQKRASLKDKSLKNLFNLASQFENSFGQDEKTPLEREKIRIEERRKEMLKNKMQAFKSGK
eukprot:403355916